MRNSLFFSLFTGLLLTVTGAMAGLLSISHTYDDLNRLTASTYNLREKEIGSSTYQYDPTGNITAVRVEMNLYEGDVNGDNRVDMADLILTLQILAMLTVEAPDMEADIDDDSRIGMQEALFILHEICAK